ncbi:hypothetical protein [Nocardia asiatica]|uniref:hypothetical protein n=1 Tax=Nocardia asiatica TaxID=209252 RepID=UPI0002EBE1E0|nr:hypothetical protein [Nocardia asiatica]
MTNPTSAAEQAQPVLLVLPALPGREAVLLTDPDAAPGEGPQRFDTAEAATEMAAHLAAITADLGVLGWNPTLTRHPDLTAAPIPPTPVLAPVPGPRALNTRYAPAPREDREQFALAIPGGLYRDADAVADGEPFTVYESADAARAAADHLAGLMAWLNWPDFPVRVVSRAVVTYTTCWAEEPDIPRLPRPA